MDAGQTRTSDLVSVENGSTDFGRRHAHLTKGLRSRIRSGDQEQSSETQALEYHKNLTNASVVSLGRSSSSQCPVSFSTTTVTSEATNFICCPSTSPNAFSPPITRTGIVSLVCAN